MSLWDVNLLKLLTEEGIPHTHPVDYLLEALNCRQKRFGPKLFKVSVEKNLFC